jgi:hypothetical protein
MTPTNPTARPATRLSVIRSSGRKRGARTITKSGTVALRIAASAESIDCSPHVIRKNGRTMLTTLITSRWPYWRGLRGSGSRASRTTVAITRNPKKSLLAIRVNGGRPLSTPILMNR